MSLWRKMTGRGPIDPKGRRIIGLTLETGEPIFAPNGHSILLSANGGGKTTRGAMPWLYSLAASELKKAILVFDSKDGELAAQSATMLHQMGRKVAVIDDLRVRPELEQFRINLNAFGAAAAAYRHDPRDTVFATETITHALIEEPKDDAKNKYFRAWPRNLIEFPLGVMLKRDPESATPGAASVILGDPDMLTSFARIEVEESEGILRSQAQAIQKMTGHEHWPQHLEEAQRALRLFSAGTRLHEAGRGSTSSHSELIRSGAIIFLVGPQRYMARLGGYYALHILAFCDALYSGAGALRIIGDEFTNTPLKSLIEAQTTLRAYGGENHLIAQSRSEIIRRFGEQETRTLEENAIVKQWFGFSSFEEAERVSKSMGEQHAVASNLSGETGGITSQESLSLIKQRWLSPAELMAIPAGQQLVHIKGIGFFLAATLSQNEIAPYCNLVADNPLEGARLPPDPKITLATTNKHGFGGRS